MNDDIDYDDIDPSLQQYESSLNEAKGLYLIFVLTDVNMTSGALRQPQALTTLSVNYFLIFGHLSPNVLNWSQIMISMKCIDSSITFMYCCDQTKSYN